jgi:predicted esterase
MIKQTVKRLFSCTLVLIACAIAIAAQDAGQVLRVSVGYNTYKNSAEKLSPEKRAEAEKFGKMAQEATGARKYGDALKHYYHAIAILRDSEWTPEVALSNALTVKLDRVVTAPSESLKLKVGQIFSLDEKPQGKISASVELVTTQGGDTLKTIKSIEAIDADFFANPTVIDIAIPEVEPGKYRVALKLKSAAATEPVTKTVTVHIERGISASFTTAKDRAVTIEKKLKAEGKNALSAAIASARYRINLIDMANAGELQIDRINFRDELKEANSILDELEAGRDPFASRRGDFRKAYLSQIDNTLQPYRVFVPSNYDGSKPFALIIALHGMGGDENSYFDSYGPGAFKVEAEKRGYIVACPKGRQPASMYMGSAEKDVLDVLEEVRRAYRIDADRIYMTGHSMGGYGTWSVAMNYPQIFAALAPVAGGGNPGGMNKIAHIPQLVVHGDNDKTVPVERSRVMVEEAKKLNVELKYIEIPKGDHITVALRTFKDVFDWFDAHRRGSKEEKAATSGSKSN